MLTSTVNSKLAANLQLVKNSSSVWQLAVSVEKYNWFLHINFVSCFPCGSLTASLVAQLVKNPPAMWETWVRSLAWEDPLEKVKATHSSILAWTIPWTIQSDMTEWLSLTLYPANLLNSFISSNRILCVCVCVEPLRFSMYNTMSSANRDSFTSSFLI